MQRRWMVAVGLLFLTDCRHGTSTKERGALERRPAGELALVLPATAERDASAARTFAAMRAVGDDEIEMATLAGQRGRASEVRDCAARIIRQRAEDLEVIARLGRESGMELRGVDADPMIRAERAAGRDAIDRLARASGEELDALYLMLEAPCAIRLSRLADQAEALARDGESALALRRIAAHARESQARAFALAPRECGGQRDVTPAGAPATIPALEGRAR
jgi:predicted outer membrane protein